MRREKLWPKTKEPQWRRWPDSLSSHVTALCLFKIAVFEVDDSLQLMPWQSKLKSGTWITKKREKEHPPLPQNCQGLHYRKSLLKITKLWWIFVFFNKWWQRTVLQWQKIQLLLTWYSVWCKDKEASWFHDFFSNIYESETDCLTVFILSVTQ